MSRLIDADALIDYLGFGNTEEEREEDVGEIVTLEDFDNQPTVFDVDKVVEQLEDIKRKKYRACQDVICEDCKYSEDCCEGDESDKLALDMAVKIVKGVGIE